MQVPGSCLRAHRDPQDDAMARPADAAGARSSNFPGDPRLMAAMPSEPVREGANIMLGRCMMADRVVIPVRDLLLLAAEKDGSPLRQVMLPSSNDGA